MIDQGGGKPRCLQCRNRFRRCPKCQKQVRIHQKRCKTCHQVLRRGERVVRDKGQKKETDAEASAPPDPRPAVLDRVGQWVAALAHRADDRPAGDRDAMASRLASPPMDSPFDADALGSGTNRLRDPYAGRQDGVGQPVVGHCAFMAN